MSRIGCDWLRYLIFHMTIIETRLNIRQQSLKIVPFPRYSGKFEIIVLC